MSTSYLTDKENDYRRLPEVDMKNEKPNVSSTRVAKELLD